jgi:hypothetical protein
MNNAPLSITPSRAKVSFDSAQDIPFDFAQDVPFDSAQDMPFDSAQDMPFDSAQDMPFDSAQDMPFDSAQDMLRRSLALAPQNDGAGILERERILLKSFRRWLANGRASSCCHIATAPEELDRPGGKLKAGPGYTIIARPNSRVL